MEDKNANTNELTEAQQRIVASMIASIEILEDSETERTGKRGLERKTMLAIHPDIFEIASSMFFGFKTKNGDIKYRVNRKLARTQNKFIDEEKQNLLDVMNNSDEVENGDV